MLSLVPTDGQLHPPSTLQGLALGPVLALAVYHHKLEKETAVLVRRQAPQPQAN